MEAAAKAAAGETRIETQMETREIDALLTRISSDAAA
jgi:hypothetical protein